MCMYICIYSVLHIYTHTVCIWLHICVCIHIYMYITESLCCTLETLLINYTSIKKFVCVND